MAENRPGTTARGTNKKARNRKKAPPRVASQNAVTPEVTASAATAKKAAGRKKGASKRQISAEQRYRMIQEAAYFRAEKEAFNCDPWKCWLVAEAEVDAQLATSR